MHGRIKDRKEIMADKKEKQERPRLEWKRLILLRGLERTSRGGKVRETPCVEITYAELQSGEVRHSFTFRIEEEFGSGRTKTVMHIPAHFAKEMWVLFRDAMALSALTMIQGAMNDPVKTVKIWEEAIAAAMEHRLKAMDRAVDRAADLIIGDLNRQAKKIKDGKEAEEKRKFTLGDQLRAKGQDLEGSG